MADRVDRFDRVIQRAHPCGDPQPCGGFESNRGVVDDRAWLQTGIDNRAFDPAGLVGHAARRCVFSRGERGRNCDLDEIAGCIHYRVGAAEVDMMSASPRITPGQDCCGRDLGGVDRTTAAEADQAIGIDSFYLGDEFAHGRERNMLLRAFVNGRAAFAQCGSYLIE